MTRRVRLEAEAEIVEAALRYNQRSDRVGISTATVRYYERIGVLPAPDRADNRCRMYDDRTVERLEFVGRAKQLGCTLEEITDLVTAWDGGECRPIQDRLRTLVADKLAAAQAEVVELVALPADLRRAAASLEHHRPIGRCNDGTRHSACSARSSTNSATPTTWPAIKQADRAKAGAHESLHESRDASHTGLDLCARRVPNDLSGVRGGMMVGLSLRSTWHLMIRVPPRGVVRNRGSTASEAP